MHIVGLCLRLYSSLLTPENYVKGSHKFKCMFAQLGGY